MTLAKILLTSIGCLAWTISPWGADNVPRTAQADSSTRGAGSADQQQGSTEPQVSGEVKPSPTGEPSGAGSPHSKTNPKRPRHKNKRKTIACADTPQGVPASAGSATATPSSGEASPRQSPADQVPSSENCPPTKVVVHQGGSSEQSIQLAGGTKQTSQAHATASPMLEATEANLKKLEERQLSDTEKDMVTQIRQFMEQSKTAVAAGDVERARTLAWKAQTLSDDLVTPPK
jgi:hypothetical protein